MPFSFCIFSGKLCCIEAAGRSVEESFNGKQTSTQSPFFVTRENMHPREDFCQSAAALISDWTLEKVTLANNVCMSVLLVTNKKKSSYCRMFLYILLSKYLCHVYRKLLDLLTPLFWLLVYLFLLKSWSLHVWDLLMYKRHFCKDNFAEVEGTGLVRTAPPDVFLFFGNTFYWDYVYDALWAHS